MNETCRQCGKKFDSKRSTALYCSGRCRAEAGRGWEQEKDKIILGALSAQVSARGVSGCALTMHERQCEENNRWRKRGREQFINTGNSKTFDELNRQYTELDRREHNRVSLPGDSDYVGVVTEEMLV